MRPLGLSAFVRCKDEEEYVVPSLLSIERLVDEIVVALNNCTDQTPALVEGLARMSRKIRVLQYEQACSAAGVGYAARVAAAPASSLAAYYNWCTAQTRFSHVCKWDADMIATPEFGAVRPLIASADVVLFDGYDILGERTTDLEPRVFRYDPPRASYIDWDLYEVLQYDYDRVAQLDVKCYLHMKLAKRAWREQVWRNPNDVAASLVPPPLLAPRRSQGRLGRAVRSLLGKIRSRKGQ